MTSDRKKKSNKANSSRSPGPRSELGKSKSKFNALKYGLFSETALLPGESESEFRQVRDSIFAELRPSGFFQKLLVDEIVDPVWRLYRLGKAEPAYFDRVRNSLKPVGDTDARSKEISRRLIAIVNEAVQIRREQARAAGLISDVMIEHPKKNISAESSSPKQPEMIRLHRTKRSSQFLWI